MTYHSSLLIPAYLSILLPIFIYPIPYINKDIISQKLFIKFSSTRLFILFFNNLYYLLITDKNIFTNYNTVLFSGIISIIIGCYLIYSVFEKLSVKGVYYGLQYNSVKFKKIEGFPFNLIHPMYIGGCLVYVGIFLIFAFKNIIDNVFLTELFYIISVQIYLANMEYILDRIYSSVKTV